MVRLWRYGNLAFLKFIGVREFGFGDMHNRLRHLRRNRTAGANAKEHEKEKVAIVIVVIVYPHIRLCYYATFRLCQ
jgi:hypothetical protein